jgi:hypothetical protein
MVERATLGTVTIAASPLLPTAHVT